MTGKGKDGAMKKVLFNIVKFLILTALGLAVASVILVSVSYTDCFINTNFDRILIFIGAADFLLLFALKKPLTRRLKISESLYFAATSVTPLLLSIIMLLVFVYSAADSSLLSKEAVTAIFFSVISVILFFNLLFVIIYKIFQLVIRSVGK